MSQRLNGIEHTHTTDDQATAITSVVLRDGIIWCGLTAGSKCLVPFDTKTRTFGTAVDLFPWTTRRPQIVQSKIHNAMGQLPDGRLAIGEGILYSWDGLPFDLNDDPNTPHIQARRVKCGLSELDLKRIGLTSLATFDIRDMEGGRVLVYDPKTGKTETVGQVAPMTYVQSMVVDGQRQMAYGHTLGDAHFFVADLKRHTIEDHGRISMFSFHNLVVAADGIVYGAWIDMDMRDKLRVLRYDHSKGFLERLPNVLLDDPGPRVQGNRGVDQWLVHSSGRIFVGMAGNGRLYEFLPQELKLREIGLVGQGGRVTSMVEDEQGRLVFSAGFPIMGVGRYDLKTDKVEHFGPITDRYERIYFHGGVYQNGTLYLAETDAGIASLWEVPLPA